MNTHIVFTQSLFISVSTHSGAACLMNSLHPMLSFNTIAYNSYNGGNLY